MFCIIKYTPNNSNINPPAIDAVFTGMYRVRVCPISMETATATEENMHITRSDEGKIASLRTPQAIPTPKPSKLTAIASKMVANFKNNPHPLHESSLNIIWKRLGNVKGRR